MNRNDAIRALLPHLASGTLDVDSVKSFLQTWARDEPYPLSLVAIIDKLGNEIDEGTRKLVGALRVIVRRDILLHHQLKAEKRTIPDAIASCLAGLPLHAPIGWAMEETAIRDFHAAVDLLRPLLALGPHRTQCPETMRSVEKAFLLAAKTVRRNPVAPGIGFRLRALRMLGVRSPEMSWMLQRIDETLEQRRRADLRTAMEALARPSNEFPKDLDRETVLDALQKRFQETSNREEQERILDLLCSWPSERAIPVLLDIVREPWVQERAALIMMLRFETESPSYWSWSGWERRFRERQQVLQPLRDQSDALAEENPGAVLLTLYSGEEQPDGEILTALTRWCETNILLPTPEQCLDRWPHLIAKSEWKVIESLGCEAAPEPPPISETPAKAVTPLPVPPPLPPPPPEPSAPPTPSLWESHLRPFLLENWYMVAGVIMVIAGCSLLAYYTWDKHWMIRYTIMPAMLAFFTSALAWVGGWIDRRAAGFGGTAATLRGAAIGLLPINFMAVALLAEDPQVTSKPIMVPLMGSIYLVFFGWGLKRWCAAVHASLGWLLGGTLLLVNILVATPPLARAVGSIGGQDLFSVLGVGFYVGFFAMAATVVTFTRRVLTIEMANEKRVPWFFGATLVVTYLQVFAWVHGYLRHLPHVYTYAPLMILAGWLVLYVERRALALQNEARRHGAESFLGFAMILLGVLMGATEQYIRIVSLTLAGCAWLYQALSRRHPVHDWIGLTFLLLGVASVGLLEKFPGPWIPALGLGAALGMGALSILFRRGGQAEIAIAAAGMQTVAMAITTAAATLTQWHYRSEPLATAACLVAVAALFAWRAWRDGFLPWVHTAMVVLALTLPYLGCADMTNRTPRGNTMAFGLAMLSFLWLGLTWIRRSPLLLAARSTVLTFYGALAVAAMILRVLAESGTDIPLLDFSGPLLMAVALVFATWHSRSLIPAALAVTIAIILHPEIKTYLSKIEGIQWGSGLGSAIAATGMILASFWLRGRPFLNRSGNGDPFPGRAEFPLCRNDHTLFTWPILAGALFLILKVDFLKFPQHLLGDGVQWRTATALVLTGIAWTLLGVYHRAHRNAIVGTHMGWICALTGISFAYGRFAEDPTAPTLLLILGLVLQGFHLLYRFALEPRRAWVGGLLTTPMRDVLAVGGLIVSLGCIGALLEGGDLAEWGPLLLFLAVQMVWHGPARRNMAFGSCLFFLSVTSLLVWTTPGSGDLIPRLSIEHSLFPILWLIVAVEAAHLALEWKSDLREKGKDLFIPFHALTTVLAAIFGSLFLIGAPWPSDVTWGQQALLIVAVLLAARSQGSGFLALLAILLGYLLAQYSVLSAVGTPQVRMMLLTLPWKCGLLAFVLAAAGHAGRWIHQRRPALLTGPFRLLRHEMPSSAWLQIPAVVLACFASLYQTVDPVMRESVIQLAASFLGTAAVALVTWSRSWNRAAGYGLSSLLLVLGNVHTIRVLLGDLLRSQGLSEVHLLCLGLAATLLEATLLSKLARRQAVTIGVNRLSLILAASILTILSANYAVHPNLGEIAPLRFVVSGAMAYLAGLYFRRAARRPGPGEEAHTDLCEGFYHFAVTMALWCAALLVPWLRKPDTALVALALPLLYLYARAEIAHRSGGATVRRLEGVTARRYRNSAATLAFLLLGLYVFRGIFQMALFPEVAVRTDHYHLYSSLAIVLGLLMLRLRGMGGTEWLSFYGGVALMGGSFFALTALPRLSPFGCPIPAAWCAVALSHFWTLASHQRSPLRTAIQRMAAIGEPEWFTLRRSWGLFLIVACQGAVLWGILDYARDPRGVAPLLLGAASVLIHHGVIRRSPIYFAMGGIEIVLALHAGFFIPSYLPREHVIWALLGIWLLGLIAHLVVSRWRALPSVGVVAAILAAATLGHVFYHHPSSPEGLWGVTAIALLAAWTPCATRSARGIEEVLAAAVLPWVPAWLVFFSQARILHVGPLLATAAIVLATGAFALLFHRRFFAAYNRIVRARPRLFDRTASWLGASGPAIFTATLWIAFLVTAIVQVSHYGTAFGPRDLALLIILHVALAVGWFSEGQSRRSMIAYVMMEICLVGLFAAVRRQILLTTVHWKDVYDVWITLAAGLCLAGTKTAWDRLAKEIRVPLLATLLALPCASLLWVIWRDLGTDTALLVVGLYSVMFAYLGKDDGESPYHLASVSGFVAFVLLLFWSKLELRVVYAYVVPVGIGILALLQLFGRRMEAGTRNRIRMVTLLAMLGSAGYYALIDERYPVNFNLSMILLCLLAMGLGGFLRIRMYVALGFAGLMVDIASILYKVLHHMPRNARMTAIGAMVLVVGAALVFGAIHYKIHREKWNARFDRLRQRLGKWE